MEQENQMTGTEPEVFISGFQERYWLAKHGKKQFIIFTDDSLLELRKYFNSLDQKGNGSIGVQQLEDPFIALGLSQSREQVIQLIKCNAYINQAVDLDGSGTIQFNEFLEIMSKIRKGDKKQKSAIYQFFKRMSQGNLGQDMDKNLPFRLNVSQYRRRKILQSIMAEDKTKKQNGTKILQAFKKQINSKQVGTDLKKFSTAGGLQMYSRILNPEKHNYN